MTNIMYLNDAKVVKFFGCRPELGRALSSVIVKRVTVGVRWSLPKLKYEPDDDVLVRPTVALKCLGKGKWEVHVEAQYRQLAEQFLIDNCM